VSDVLAEQIFEDSAGDKDNTLFAFTPSSSPWTSDADSNPDGRLPNIQFVLRQGRNGESQRAMIWTASE
jgi:hypothetical protein